MIWARVAGRLDPTKAALASATFAGSELWLAELLDRGTDSIYVR